jgi:hypothetical protein
MKKLKKNIFSKRNVNITSRTEEYNTSSEMTVMYDRLEKSGEEALAFYSRLILLSIPGTFWGITWQ